MPETERRCMAMGRGSKENPHYYFADIDDKVERNFLCNAEPDALIYETRRGFHVISGRPITSEAILKICDPLCPGNAVRFYPHDDFSLVQRPRSLCIKVAKVYESVFEIPMLPRTMYSACSVPLKFGVYVAEKDGIKLTGAQRHEPAGLR